MRGRWNDRVAGASADHAENWLESEVIALVSGVKAASKDSSLVSIDDKRWSVACDAEANLLEVVFSLVARSETDSRRLSVSEGVWALKAIGLWVAEGIRDSPAVVVGTVGAEAGRFVSDG